MSKKKLQKLKRDPFYDQRPTASATECTGLTPRLPQNDSEAESYADLYSLHRQKPAD